MTQTVTTTTLAMPTTTNTPSRPIKLTKPIESKGGCIAAAMEIIGNKWTALILRDLTIGPKHFCELEKTVGGINPRTLSQRLDDLEAHGIVTKQSYSDNPSRPDYRLTQKGHDLIPVLQQMAAWGAKHYTAVG